MRPRAGDDTAVSCDDWPDAKSVSSWSDGRGTLAWSPDERSRAPEPSRPSRAVAQALYAAAADMAAREISSARDKPAAVRARRVRPRTRPFAALDALARPAATPAGHIWRYLAQAGAVLAVGAVSSRLVFGFVIAPTGQPSDAQTGGVAAVTPSPGLSEAPGAATDPDGNIPGAPENSPASPQASVPVPVRIRRSGPAARAQANHRAPHQPARANRAAPVRARATHPTRPTDARDIATGSKTAPAADKDPNTEPDVNRMDVPRSALGARAPVEADLPDHARPHARQHARPPLGESDTVRPALRASLYINSRPWADVLVDGEPVGMTPIKSWSISPGLHTVRLVNPAYGMAKSIELEVTPGERITLVESLDREQ